MVAIDQVKPVFLIKLRHQPEGVAVYVYNLGHGTVFPEFIAVTQLDISKIIHIIILKCCKKQILVFQEIIRRGTVAPVAVTHQNIFRIRCKRKMQCIFKRLTKT